MRVIIAVTATCMALSVTGSARPATLPPHLTATSPAPNTVDLAWVGVEGPLAIVWQCSDHGCYDTLHPNTGSLEVEADTGLDAYRVCYPGPSQDICSNVALVGVR